MTRPAWTCLHCRRSAPEARRDYTSVLCRDCRAAIKAAGQHWCPVCRTVVDPATVSGGICLPCHAAKARAKRAARSRWACAWCLKWGLKRDASDLCRPCRKALADAGQFYCPSCKCAKPLAEKAHHGPCRACRRQYSRRYNGTLPPPGYIDLGTASKRLHLHRASIALRCRLGKVPGAIRAPHYWWIPEEYRG